MLNWIKRLVCKEPPDWESLDSTEIEGLFGRIAYFDSDYVPGVVRIRLHRSPTTLYLNIKSQEKLALALLKSLIKHKQQEA